MSLLIPAGTFVVSYVGLLLPIQDLISGGSPRAFIRNAQTDVPGGCSHAHKLRA